MGKPKYGFITAQPAQCRKCGTPITLLESEATSIMLNASGYPIGYHVERYKCVGFCPKCGTEYTNIGKVDLKYYIIDEN